MVEMGWPHSEGDVMNAVYYSVCNGGFSYGPFYGIFEAVELAEEIGGWVEDENGLRVNFT